MAALNQNGTDPLVTLGNTPLSPPTPHHTVIMQGATLVDLKLLRQKRKRGKWLVNLSTPDTDPPVIVEIALDTTQTLLMQDRLPNPLMKSALDVVHEYDKLTDEANEVDPATGEKRGWTVDNARKQVELLEALCRALIVQPRWVNLADAGIGACPEDAICLADLNDDERASIFILAFGGLDALQTFREKREGANRGENVRGIQDEAERPNNTGLSRTRQNVVRRGITRKNAARGPSGPQAAVPETVSGPTRINAEATATAGVS